MVQVAGEELLVDLILAPVGACIPLASAGSALRMVPHNAPNLAQVSVYLKGMWLLAYLLAAFCRAFTSTRRHVIVPACTFDQHLAVPVPVQISMHSGLEWNSDDEGTAGAHTLKVEDLVELSEGNSRGSVQASIWSRAIVLASDEALLHMHVAGSSCTHHMRQLSL